MNNQQLRVVFVCGDPTIYIGNQRVAKVSGTSTEGAALTNWARRNTERPEGQRALSFMGGSVLVTPDYAEFVFRDDDLQWDNENNAYRWIHIPNGDYQELGEFLTRGNPCAYCRDSGGKDSRP